MHIGKESEKGLKKKQVNMHENYKKEQDLKTLIKRVEAHIRNSNDFKMLFPYY
jgi:ribosomal protein S20